MPMLETPQGSLAYNERGAGHPLVLLPSGANDRHDCDEVRALLPERFRSISLDWPGHGESPPGQGVASAMIFADLVERLVARLAPQGAVVVDNSVGGFSAARLAIRRPDLVKGLVLVDSGGSCRAPTTRARVLRADGPPVVLEAHLSPVCHPLHASSHRRGHPGERRRSGDDQTGSRPAGRERLVADRAGAVRSPSDPVCRACIRSLVPASGLGMTAAHRFYG